MAQLSVDQAILKAKSHARKGEIREAQRLYQTILNAFPKNKRAQKGMVALNKLHPSTITEAPPQEAINQLANLYNKGQLSAVVEQAKTLIEQYPSAFIIWNILGAANKELGQVGEAVRSFKKVTELNPTYADGFNNLGVTLQERGKLKEAIESFNNALSIKPDYADCYINLGAALQEYGKLDESLEAYNKAITFNPDIAYIHNNMGVVLQMQNNLEEAIKSYHNALSLNPAYAEAHYNMGHALKEQGNLEEAIKSYHNALSLNPENADAQNNVGAALKETGKLEEAIEAYKKALLLKPDNAVAHYNLGNALQEQGKMDQAIKVYKKTLSLKPDYAEAHYNMGSALQEQGKIEETIAAYKKAISLKPDYTEAYNNLGNALKDQGKLEEAIEAYKNALSLKPDYAEAYFNIGNAFKDQGNLEEAIEAYKNALSLKPDNAEAYNNMGAIFQDQGQLQQAIAAYKKTLSLKPDYAEAYNNMGAVFQDQGELQEAIAAYKNALVLKPDYAAAHRNLSGLIRYRPNDPQVVAVDEFLRRPDFSDYERCHLHYTYAKMNSDFGELKAAFEHYVAGGALRKKILSYDLEQDKLFFAQIKNTAPKLKELSFNEPFEVALQTPIFILGMPRSGTTLVEQIVSSHSQVHGAGELSFLERFGARLSLGAREINSDNLIKVRTAYLTEIKKVSENKPFLTDKMPHNFLYIGLILKALPEAKIIHVKRDPAATCWSNFKHYFTSEGLGYSYDLDDTRSYYKMYQELMEFWDTIYGDRIYHLYYERLTVEQEIETKKLIEHLELPWEDACLSPQKNKRRVRTASQQQVRKKVYAGSSQNWREFKPYLDGVFSQLELPSI